MPNDRIILETSTAPADGERRAMTGYLPQYELAAWAIMGHLRERTLNSIRIGDIYAGRVDDFVILSDNAVAGHSVKWSESRDTITFRNFITPDGKAPCWIAQLADGWKRLCTTYPNRCATVRFITCNIPSKNDKCPGVEEKSFASFYNEAWIPFQTNGQDIPEEWGQAWEGIQTASGLSVDEFNKFAKCCFLDFHARTAADRTIISRDDELLRKQLKDLAAEIANIVRDPSRKIEFSKDELLQRVGWSHLLEFKHQHEFPTNDPYEPIDSTVHDLTEKLESLTSGYIVLLGSPGSGKSTLLTHSLEAWLNRHRLVKYYAYVPDSANPRTRGESANFLHDLVLSLEHAGFMSGQSQGEYDRALLLERLHNQLQMLGEDFVKTGFPTVILIDGLDHIPREQSPLRSLIEDLPLPDQIPEGVYFVLGSQTDELPGLPPAVQQSIQEKCRRIQIKPMSKQQVLKIIAETKLPVALTQGQNEKMVVLVNGHPLALSLLLNRLKSAQNRGQIEESLTETAAFTGDIDKYYYAYWKQVEKNDSVATLMGCLARLRRPIDIDWVASWELSTALSELRRHFEHFFREDRPGHWVFFHNSFRMYVLEKSAALKGGTVEFAEKAYQAQLAEICESSKVPHSWEVIHHLSMAGESTRVLSLATSDYFRDQLYALRPIESITHDARQVAWAAGQQKNVSALIEATLFLAELSQRAYSLDAWRVGDLLLSTGCLDNAFEYLWEGNELQINATEALRVSRKLFASGNEPLARRLFEAAEPFSLIQPADGSKMDYNHDMQDLLQQWAETVPLFRSVEDAISLVNGFVPPKSQFNEAPESDNWQVYLFYWAAASMNRFGRLDDFILLEECLRDAEGDDPYYSVWLTINRYRSLRDCGNITQARSIVEQLLREPLISSYPDSAKIVIAQDAHALLSHKGTATELFNSVETPSISLEAGEADFGDAIDFFRFYRLLMITGSDVSPITVVPDPTNEDDWPRVLLERSLVQLARASADAFRGQIYSSGDIRQKFYGPLRLFHRTTKESRRSRKWYQVQQMRNKFDKLLVDVVREHGDESIEALRSELESHWQSNDQAWQMHPSQKRNLVISLYKAGVSEKWTRSHLEGICEEMLEGTDVSGKTDECEAQVEAWKMLGDKQAAVNEIKRMVSVSFGVGYRKDYQMDEWVEWLGLVLHDDADKVGERIALFAAAIAGTEETTEGGGTSSAALSLIECCYLVSPRRAVALVYWFEKHGCINHAEAVAKLLEVATEKKLCKASTLMSIYEHYLLRFSTQAHKGLVQTLLIYCANGVSNAKAASTCHQLVKAIKTHALPPSRSNILHGLVETAENLELPLADCDLDTLPARHEEQERYGQTLELDDGKVLKENEALEYAVSVDGLINLVNQSKGRYYGWTKLFEALLPKLARLDVFELIDRLPGGFDESLVFSALSRRLSELGERDKAWELGQQALKISPQYGWMSHYDGGTRIEAVGALVLAKPVLGREVAIEQIASNLSSESGTPFDLARCLIKTIPLLGEDLNLAMFYSSVEEYVKNISSPLHLLSDAASELGSDYENDTFDQALCDMLARHMADIVPILAQCAMKSMVELILNGCQSAERTITAMLTGTEFEKEAGVLLLDALACKNINALNSFADALLVLVLDKNWWISSTALRLCQSLGLDEMHQRPYRKLSPIYNLVLPPLNDAKREVEAGEPLPDSENPIELLRPYDSNLSLMAKITGIDETNIYIATVNEMKQVATDEELTEKSERELRYCLERAGLKFSFRRKRGAVARIAMRRIASDLIDANRLPTGAESTLLSLISCSDPQIALVDPSMRPSEIGPLDGMDKHYSKAEEWAYTKTPSFTSHLREIEGRMVIGETTTLKALCWSVPKERRVSLIGEITKQKLDSEHPFERVFDVQMTEYENSAPQRLQKADPLIIINNQILGADTDGVDWIALNPEIGKTLGWKLSPTGLFQWVNEAKEVMVETVWWKDGCVQLFPYQSECEVAEGFVVLASPTAATAILDMFDAPTRFFLIQRSAISNGQVNNAQAVQDNEPLRITGSE